MPTCDPPAVYQLRIRLDRISPLIWRRLLVTGEISIADLHASIQTAFGWTDSHLHRFVIHGKSYGIAYAGGMTFADDPHQVCLADFRLRTGERFTYEYNFHIPWRHEETISNRGQRRATRFRYNPRVVLVPLPSLLGTAPWPAACELRGAACPPPIPRLSTNSASVSTQSAR